MDHQKKYQDRLLRIFMEWAYVLEHMPKHPNYFMWSPKAGSLDRITFGKIFNGKIYYYKIFWSLESDTEWTVKGPVDKIVIADVPHYTLKEYYITKKSLWDIVLYVLDDHFEDTHRYISQSTLLDYSESNAKGQLYETLYIDHLTKKALAESIKIMLKYPFVHIPKSKCAFIYYRDYFMFVENIINGHTDIGQGSLTYADSSLNPNDIADMIQEFRETGKHRLRELRDKVKQDIEKKIKQSIIHLQRTKFNPKNDKDYELKKILNIETQKLRHYIKVNWDKIEEADKKSVEETFHPKKIKWSSYHGRKLSIYLRSISYLLDTF